MPLPGQRIADEQTRLNFENLDGRVEDAESSIETLEGLIRSGTGTPESNVTAPVGTIYLRTNGGAGTTLYVKESGAGNTGWVAK